MTETTSVSGEGVRLLLKTDDGPPRDLGELDRGELEILRAAVEDSLARLPVPEQVSPGAIRDNGFSCEWWPPD